MKTKRIRIIGVPMDLGQSRRGVDMGPSAVRYAGLTHRLEKLGHKVEDAGNIEVPDRENLPVSRKPGANYLDDIADTCKRIYRVGRQAVEDGRFPIFLGGDHSISIGTVGGITHSKPAGLIWIDAHGDFNIPATSPNGNIHGMPVAVLLGYGAPELVNLGRRGPKVKPANVALIGSRDLDYDEKTMLKNSGITIYTMREVDELGMATVARKALEKMDGLDRIHVSLDLDALDPMEATGVGTPASGGLTYREAHLLMELLADSARVSSMDIVEINPVLDNHNRTAETAVELTASLLGETII